MNFSQAEAFLDAKVKARQSGTLKALRAHLFGAQLDFFDDKSTFADALCTRRAGKSEGVGTWLLEGPLSGAGPSLYFTISRKEAKRIIWPILLRLNRTFGLGYEANESELILKHNGIPSVFLMGVNTKDEVEKARGTGWGRVVGDEAQSLPAYVEGMLNDVIMPSLMDHDGKVRMIGTPGPVPVGYFYGLTRNDAWSHHAWSVWDNPHIPNARGMLAQVLKARGVSEEDPSIQREWFGRWVYDPNALVFRFDAAANTARILPSISGAWSTVVGVDLGFDDSDAIAVIAWCDELPTAYIVEEWVGPKQTITQLAERLQATIARHDPLAVVMDTGGLGKKIAAEIRARHGLPIKAAEKTEKFSHIELVNDALRSRRLHALPDSRFAHDSMLVEWDRTNPEKLKISDRYHSDIADAVLYAFREAQYWMHTPKVQAPERGSLDEAAAMEAEHVASLEREIAERKAEAAMWSSWEW